MYSPEDFARVWTETLEYVGENGLLDIIEWVDFCNEFPLDVWAPGAVRYMGEASGEPLGLAIVKEPNQAVRTPDPPREWRIEALLDDQGRTRLVQLQGPDGPEASIPEGVDNAGEGL